MLKIQFPATLISQNYGDRKIVISCLPQKSIQHLSNIEEKTKGTP